MRAAAYAGSFDPITNGHLAIATAASRMFDKLYFLVAVNPDKRGRFKPEERVALARASLAHLPNVEVVSLQGQYVVQWARENGCGWLVRGLRGAADLDTERVIEKVNASIVPDVQTVYIPAPQAVENVSSSLVMGLVGPRGWRAVVKGLVPKPVYEALRNQYLLGRYKEGVPDATARSVSWNRIVEAYSDPGRHYHTLDHVADMLDLLDQYARPQWKWASWEDDPTAYWEVVLAVFFHDLVNGGMDGQDEEKSVQAAERALNAEDGCLSLDTKKLIRATYKAGVGQELSPKAQLFVDADMAILGAHPERYAEYARQIRQEYAQFSDDQYRQGRAHFLAETLARPRIFFSGVFYNAFEKQARENMQRELDSLEARDR